MTGIKIPVEAQFSPGSTDQALKDFQQRFNRMGQQISQANKVKFQPLDKATVDHIKQVQNGFQSLVKISGDFRQRLKATGQESKGFLDLDWSKLYSDKGVQHRQMQKAMDYVSGGGRFTQPEAPPPPPGGGGGGGGGDPRQPKGPPSQLARVARAAASSAGPMGNIATTAIGEGRAFGIGAGVAGLVGGIAALGIGKLISGIREKVGVAQDEAIGYDTLKRTLGDVNVGFRVLKESLRDAGRNLDMNFNESLALGQQFSKTSGLSGEAGARSLADEIRNAGGFSRAFGLDPSQGTAFFAQQRQFGATKNADDSRRMGLMIGEGIAKAGVFSKVEEVLEAIGSYTAQQTRMGMNTANVGGYMSFLTGMMGSGIPGTDPGSSAALMARVNASIQGGGGAGEAGQNFLYSALGSGQGLNPLQSMLLREQGAFGSAKGTFGKGSLYNEYMGMYGGQQASGDLSGQTNLSTIMEKMEKQFTGRPELMANAVSRLLGTTMSQAMSLSVVNKKYGGEALGGLQNRLGRLGINLSDVNETATLRMGSIEANKGMSEDAKDEAIKKAAAEGQIKTEGSETRKSIKGVENAMQDAASRLLTPLNEMRLGIMYMAGQGKKSSRQIMESMILADQGDRDEQIKSDVDPKIAAARKERDLMTQLVRGSQGIMDPLSGSQSQKSIDNQQLLKDAQKKLDALELERAMRLRASEEKSKAEIVGLSTKPTTASTGGGSVSKEVAAAMGSNVSYDAMFQEAGKEHGVDWRLLKAIASKESGFKPEAVSPANENGTQDFGLMQHNSKYLKERGLDGDKWKDPRANIQAAAKLLKQNMTRRGNVQEAVRDYNGSGPKAEAYSSDVMARYRSLLSEESPAAMRSNPTEALPKGESARESVREAKRMDAMRLSAQVNGTFRLEDQRGQQLATTEVSTTMGPPHPIGAL